ncbi:TRAP transporter substrate-binding protein DctP [Nesterenkonia haasae]|uniref:TRAP transporter substrate-binding protein DctP n=1 Tax=Nesterenkonia haasae TaxID=2587813 RepID=UPI0013912102|nr:TRAP transporter substrate-binding protein DctP [Nesterenkonia haasae]NDK33259.1 hypothetical protein [Nesterenkonia haasae]
MTTPFIQQSKTRGRQRQGSRITAALCGAVLLFATTAACASSTDDDTLTIRFASGFPEGNAISEGHMWWMDEVEERSNGRITFDRNFGGALYGALDIAPALQSNALDFGVFANSYQPAESPLGTITEMPFMTDNPVASAYAFNRLSTESDVFSAELESLGIQPIVFGAIDVGGAVTTQPLDSLEDFNGLSIRSVGAQGKALEALGANPIFMGADELYQSLERGVIDGAAPFALDTGPSMSLHEVAPHVTYLGMGVYVNVALGFSENVWAQVPEDLRDIMFDVTDDYYGGDAERILIEQYEAACEAYIEVEGSFTILDEGEIAAWREEIGDGILNEWKDFSVDNGVAANDVEQFLSDYRSMIAEFESTSDYQDGIRACAARAG